MHRRLLALLLLACYLSAGCAGRSRVPQGEDADAWSQDGRSRFVPTSLRD